MHQWCRLQERCGATLLRLVWFQACLSAVPLLHTLLLVPASFHEGSRPRLHLAGRERSTKTLAPLPPPPTLQPASWSAVQPAPAFTVHPPVNDPATRWLI